MKLVPRLLTLGLALPLGGLTLAVLIAGALFRRSLVQDLDHRLLAQAAVESVSLFDSPDNRPHLHLTKSPLAGEIASFAATCALYDPAGQLVVTSPQEAPIPDRLVLDPPSTSPQLSTHDGFRELTVSVARDREGYYTLRLATSLAPIQATSGLFYRVVGGTVAAIGLGLAALLHAQASRLAARMRELIAFVPRLRAAEPHEGPVASGRDELAELGLALVETSQHIHAQQASQERFLASAAHQLRTPLTVLRTEIDLALRRERPADELRDALARARGEVERLALLARKLLDFESLRVQPVNVREVDLRTLVGDVVTRLAPVARERHVTLAAGSDPGDLPCHCDPLLLAQAIENVLDNAIRFAPPSSTVTVTVERLASACRVAIHDEGPGIPAAERARLFEPFHRGSSASAQTGLGLAFAAEVLQKHRGRIFLDQPDRPGTTFALELPPG